MCNSRSAASCALLMFIAVEWVCLGLIIYSVTYASGQGKLHRATILNLDVQGHNNNSVFFLSNFLCSVSIAAKTIINFTFGTRAEEYQE